MARPRSFGSRKVTSRSPIRTAPSPISSSPARMLRSVVLPQPEGPRRTTNSPSSILRSRLAITVSAPYFLTMFLNSTVGISQLSLDRPGGDALDEEFAEHEIDDERRRRGQKRRGHVDGIVLLAGRRQRDVVED